MVGAFRSFRCSIVPASSCSLSGPLVISVDVMRLKSYVDSFLGIKCVSLKVSINKLDLVPYRIVAGLVGVFKNGAGLSTRKSYIPVVLFDPFLCRSPSFPDVNFATLAENLIDYAILFRSLRDINGAS